MQWSVNPLHQGHWTVPTPGAEKNKQCWKELHHRTNLHVIHTGIPKRCMTWVCLANMLAPCEHLAKDWDDTCGMPANVLKQRRLWHTFHDSSSKRNYAWYTTLKRNYASKWTCKHNCSWYIMHCKCKFICFDCCQTLWECAWEAVFDCSGKNNNDLWHNIGGPWNHTHMQSPPCLLLEA